MYHTGLRCGEEEVIVHIWVLITVPVSGVVLKKKKLFILFLLL